MKKFEITTSNKAGDYDFIIKKVWEQFQSGGSIFAKEVGLYKWPNRQILIEEEMDSSDFILTDKNSEHCWI